MRFRNLALSAVACLLAAAAIPAQEREDRTLLTTEQMRAIINEASGERAMHHVLDLVPYQFVRPPSEYQGHFRESDVLAKLAKDYGFSNVGIEDYPTGQTWQPVIGELWMTSPESLKLYDIHDIPESLASTNATGDISGDLVNVNQGTALDFEGKDVKGKFVLSTAPSGLGGVYSRAVAAGAIGALGISAIGPGARAVDYPTEIVSTTVNAQPGTAAWALSPRIARQLETALNRGQKVTIRSVTKTEQVPNKQEIVHAEIPGDGSTTQEVAIGGHLFEGYIKQGANDDNSGCALTLEIGRAYLKLINEGKLPKPKRTINFNWVQEISGTNAWFTAHPEKAKTIIGDLNFDMEGIRLTTSRSYWIMQRTPDTFPSYINDIGQSMMEYVSELARERVRYRGNGYAPSVDITSPNGSQDAFYIKIDKHYGSSDHVTYMQHGVPAVMFITWPDMWYHSSQDTPDKQDPTQYQARGDRRDRRARGDRERGGRAGRTRHDGEPGPRHRTDGGLRAERGQLPGGCGDCRRAAPGVEGRARVNQAPSGGGERRHPIRCRVVPGSGGCHQAARFARGGDRQESGRARRGGSRRLRAAGPAAQHGAHLRSANDRGGKRSGGPDGRVRQRCHLLRLRIRPRGGPRRGSGWRTRRWRRRTGSGDDRASPSATHECGVRHSPGEEEDSARNS